ncbi:type ISP restriction/modification enzyme [Micromonospora echinospora]|uniref:type ISP restriction/modification enzyme n=1 Tax=Micromonospora echinospora TaxID=1877 RepID=UPI003797ABAD
MADGVSGWLSTAVSVFGKECKEALAGPGEREAAIRPPIERLLHTVCDSLRLSMTFYPETAMDDLKVRPDYAIRINRAITGYLEVKKPETNIDPPTFKGHNRTQWERLKDLPNLLYTNGGSWMLYRDGERVGDIVHLDKSLATAGSLLTVRDGTFERLLRDFLDWKPAPIRNVQQLVRAIAPLCRLLRHEVLDQLDREAAAIRAGQAEEEQPFTGLAKDWRRLLFPTADNSVFADGYAQAVTFALLLATSEGISLTDGSLHEVGRKLGSTHSVMGKALQLLTDPVSDRFRVTLDLLVRVIGAVEWDHIRTGRADAYLHLYEDFLEVYDDELRKASGTYYTPTEVVTEMVRLVEELLLTRLGCAEGFWSPQVTTVDPAMGTGTFLHAIIKRVAEQVAEAEGPGAVPQAIEQLAKRLIGFELQMGPYAVAELRESDMLRKYQASLPPGGPHLYVTDTLDDPYAEQQQIASTYAPLSSSRQRANQIKASKPVTVVIGNPPYRERAEGLGGWIENGSPNEPAPLDKFRLADNGRTEYVLKNLYVYFWRWATWKVFDAHPEDSQGVVAFITTAGYLRGPGFKGMRKYLRETCDEGWIIDVSPEGMRPDVPTRVFPGVQQPLAIGIFVRHVESDRSQPGRIWYTALSGRRQSKYKQLQELSLDSGGWRLVRPDWIAPLTPAADSGWDDYPPMGDILPWVSPGVKSNRNWVYSASVDVLKGRWGRLVAASELSDRKSLFKETRDRTVQSRVDPLPGFDRSAKTLAVDNGPCLSPVRVAYRNFDRHWIIPDNRLLDYSRPDLWRASGTGQIFVIEQHAHPFRTGPGVMFSTLVPDMDQFNGRGGRVLPMRHAGGAANVPPLLLAVLGQRLGRQVSVEDLVAYIGGVVAHRGFTLRFAEDLVTPGIRVPLTADPELWDEVVAVGRQVVWLHTYGEAFGDESANRPKGNIRYPAGDDRRPLNTVAVPATPLPETISHDAAKERLHVGGGVFAPVPAAVWEYDVGGMAVVKKWFSYRKANPGGRKSSPLDDIHVDRWPHEWTSELNDLLTVLRRLVELEPQQDDLLERVVAGPQITVADLAAAGVLPVPAKARKAHRHAADLDRKSDPDAPALFS